MAGALTWLRTVRSVKPSMLAARVGSAAKRMLRMRAAEAAARRLARAGASAPGLCLRAFSGFSAPGRAGEGLEDALDIEERKLSLIGAEIAIPPRADWNAPRLSRQARYKLHGFAYLESLAQAAQAGARAEAWTCFRGLVADWLRACRLPVGDGWDSYPLSLRAVNWLKCAAAFERELADDAEFRLAFGRSLYAQGCFLERNVEWRLRCNHLVENARALLFLGSAFASPLARQWRAVARRMLDLAAREQFFGDGCHVERSPTYHMIVLEAFLDCAEVLRAWGETPPEPWLDVLSRGASFGKAILHPDGEVPLINDSALGEAREPAAVLGRASAILGEAPARADLSDGGFVAVRKGEIFLVADGGVPSPAYNPAHSHAGALSYELSVFGRRAVVDTGVAGYAADEARDYCRGTRAHNTVSVGRGDQSEMWASFRVGGRAECFISDTREDKTATRFSGRCCWYGGRIVHSREWIVLHHEGVLVLDSVSGAQGEPVESLLHLAPKWTVERLRKRRWRCESGERVFFVSVFEPWREELAECRLWRRFGAEEKGTLLALRTEGDVELRAYFIDLRPRDALRFRPSERLLVLDGWSYNC